MEQLDPCVDSHAALQLGIEFFQFAVARQAVQEFVPFLATMDEGTAQFQEAANVLVLDAVGLLHLGIEN